MSLFSNLGRSFGLKYSDPNPADNAMNYLNQVPGVAKQYLEPYIQPGMQAQNQLQNLYAPNNEVSQGYRKMSSNPMDYVNEIMRGYEPSAGYKYKENRALQAMRNSANAGGFAGTQNDQEEQARTVNGLMGEDMQQFLQNIFGTQQQGLGGLERMMAGRAGTLEPIAQRGYGASGDLANIIGSNLGQQAGLSFQGQRQQNFGKGLARQNRMGLFKDIAGMFGGFGGGGWNNPNNGGGYQWGNPNY